MVGRLLLGGNAGGLKCRARTRTPWRFSTGDIVSLTEVGIESLLQQGDIVSHPSYNSQFALGILVTFMCRRPSSITKSYVCTKSVQNILS